MKPHLAQFWKAQSKKKIICQLCHHRCVLSLGQKGLCGVRENQDGKLYTLNYAKAIALYSDPIEKKPLYHFFPGSKILSVAAAGCNFRCNFCQNWNISQITKGKTGTVAGDVFSPQQIVTTAVNNYIPAIAYTYTEPTVFFEYAYDTALLARDHNLKNVFVTNGYQTDQTIKKMSQVIDAANIDLKSFSDAYYHKICGASLKPVLNTIRKLYELGVWIEVTTLVIPEKNDSEQELKKIAEFIASISTDIPWHISRFFPTYKMLLNKITPIEVIKKAYYIGKMVGLKFVYAGNIDENDMSNTSCAECGSKLIERNRYLINSSLMLDKCPHCHTILPGCFK